MRSFGFPPTVLNLRPFEMLVLFILFVLCFARSDGQCRTANDVCLTKAQITAKIGEDDVYADYLTSMGEDNGPCFDDDQLTGLKNVCVVPAGVVDYCFCHSDPSCDCTMDPICTGQAVPDCNSIRSLVPPLVWQSYGEDHTMNKYCGTNVENCNDICQRELPPDEIAVILALHNDVRKKIRDGASVVDGIPPFPIPESMPDLVWDADLAVVAQTFADQCTPDLSRDSNRRTPDFESVGQNRAWEAIQRAPQQYYIKYLFDKYWLSQVRNVNAPGPTDYFDQIISGSTTKIGCGWVLSTNYGAYEQLLICNYGPAATIGSLGLPYEPAQP